MSEPYLIAHLVRGTPAFDIAIRCDDMGTESDPGPWWIIPTSGHRAYPFHNKIAGYATIPLSELECWPTGWLVKTEWLPWVQQVMTDPLPDHYTTYAAPRTGLITNLAERLGFVPKPITITRR